MTTPRAQGPARRLFEPARTFWMTAFRDPMHQGRIRLGGLDTAESQVAKVGLVTLVLLLGSLLFADEWRRGTLLSLGDDSGERLTFLPIGLLPVTLVVFLIAWILLTWGALTASWPVKGFVAAAFLIVNAPLVNVPVLDNPPDRWVIEHGPTLLRIGFIAPAAVLLLSAGLALLPRLTRWLLPVFRLALCASVAMLFLGLLWVHLAFVDEGFPDIGQNLMDGAISDIDRLLRPLVFLSAIGVVGFGRDIAHGVTRATSDVPARIGRWLLVTLLAVKLWFLALAPVGDWATYLQDRPTAALRTVVSLLLLALLALLVARLRPTSAFDAAKERLFYGSSVGLALTALVVFIVSGVDLAATALFGLTPDLVLGLPDDALAFFGDPVLAGLAVIAGIWLLRRRRDDLDLELGSGLVLLGAWVLHLTGIRLLPIDLGFSPELADIVVTGAVAVVLARRWRTIDISTVLLLTVVTIFCWLVMSRGDWISWVGAIFGLPAILVVVVGLAFTLYGGAGFTATSGRRVPQGARVLMFVGYLVLSVTVLHWVETTHASTFTDDTADVGFLYLGIPWAAWLIGRRLVHPELDAGVVQEPARPVSALMAQG